MRTHWKIEVFGISREWRQIGFPDNETEAFELFERAVREYPSDMMVRLRDGETVRTFRPAEWVLPQDDPRAQQGKSTRQ